MELKLKHQEKNATFLDLDITIEDNLLAWKYFDKWDKFLFFIARMPYLSSNIPSSIFYGSIFSDFLQIAWCTLRLRDFVSEASQLYTKMITQLGNKASILRQIKSLFQRYPEIVSKYCQTYYQITNKIIMY